MPRRAARKPKTVEPVSTEPVEINTQKYEIVALIGGKSSKLPVGGRSYYFVMAVDGKITVFHPFSFTSSSLTPLEFSVALDKNDWFPTAEKVITMLNKKKDSEIGLGRMIPKEVEDLLRHFSA